MNYVQHLYLIINYYAKVSSVSNQPSKDVNTRKFLTGRNGGSNKTWSWGRGRDFIWKICRNEDLIIFSPKNCLFLAPLPSFYGSHISIANFNYLWISCNVYFETALRNRNTLSEITYKNISWANNFTSENLALPNFSFFEFHDKLVQLCSLMLKSLLSTLKHSLK